MRFIQLFFLCLLLSTSSLLGSPCSSLTQCSNAIQRFDNGNQAAKSYALVVAVLSGEDDQGYKPTWLQKKSYRDRRREVRETWKVQAREANIPLFFMLSDYNLTAQDSTDAETNGDVLLVPDPKGAMWGYQGLSAKVLFLMQFIDRQCAEVKYLLKCDDDSYVHVPRLLLFLAALPGRAEYIGKRHCGVSPFFQKVSSGKNGSKSDDEQWALPTYRNNTGLTMFPCYMQGGGYILSGDVVRALAFTSRTVGVQLYKGVEDMAVGLWVSGWNVTPINLDRHYMFIDFTNSSAVLRQKKAKKLCKNMWLIVHRVSCGQMANMVASACPSATGTWETNRYSVKTFQERLPDLLRNFRVKS